MLSRTADSLFWMARYMERAENMARLIDMGRRMAATPSTVNGFRNEWPAVLAAAGCAEQYFEQHPAPDHWSVISFLMLSRENPSSVASCFEAARANARSARGALTVEMWRAINDAWIELRTLGPERLENGSMSPLLDWVKERAGVFRGASESTALRNDGFDFLRLGLFVERLDNTARLVDVKNYMAARRGEDVGVDHYEWMALLRAAGVLRAYHAVYRASYEPERIVTFLLHNPQCPRSLTFCAGRIRESVESLARFYGEREGAKADADRLVGQVDACIGKAACSADLSAAISAVIRCNNALSAAVAETYHFAPRLAVDVDEATAQAEAQDDAPDDVAPIAGDGAPAAPVKPTIRPRKPSEAAAVMAQAQSQSQTAPGGAASASGVALSR